MPVRSGHPMPADGHTEAQHHDYWVFSDGRYLRYRDVRLGLMTHAFSYGTSCFEGMRAYWNPDLGQLFLMQAGAHFRRLLQSSRVLRMALPYTVEGLIDVTCQVLRRNEFHEDCFIRPTAYKSSEEIGCRLHGIRDSLGIYAIPFGDYIDVNRGLRCMVASWRRVSDTALPARAKIGGSYVNSALAKSEALENGFDEAIVLTSDGHVSEGSAENLFMIKEGVAVTPSVTDDILEGITRAALIRLFTEEIGIPVVARSIDRTELYACDELLLCGTAAQVAPVVEVDHRAVGDGQIGPIARQVQAAYYEAVRGCNAKYSDWLTGIY